MGGTDSFEIDCDDDVPDSSEPEACSATKSVAVAVAVAVTVTVTEDEVDDKE